ncbi:MAG: hypothetical protein KatS3mg039_1305 [Candidatus Kapaibacterium sp.]|nr:MAG: hypothetical protein KatS3mg039_1305 [Candidatus Kapabacteria bacterium]
MGARLVNRAALILFCLCSIGRGQPAKMLLGSVAITSRCTDAITSAKAEAALALALENSGQYHLVTYRDLHQRGHDTGSIHASLPSRRIQVRIDCFHNLLRADIELVLPDTMRRGSGYSLIRHRWEQSDQLLADPALLEAIERAFCVASGDWFLYARRDSAGVRPASLLAVTNLEIRDNPSLPQWELFTDAITTSYSGILAAITGGQRAPGYVVLDVDTRDSIYAHFRLYEPEPGMPPSRQEIAALAYFGVEALMSGWLERTAAGARLELRLLDTHPDGSVSLRARVERQLNDDSRVAFLEAIAAAAKELLSTHSPSPR